MSGASSVRKWTQTAWHTLQSLLWSPVDKPSGRARPSSCTAPWPDGPSPGSPGEKSSKPSESQEGGKKRVWAISHACHRVSITQIYFPQRRRAHTFSGAITGSEDGSKNKPAPFLLSSRYKNNVLIDAKAHPEKYTAESNYNMHSLEIKK